MPDDETSTKKSKSHSKRSNPISGISIEKTESEDQNKDVNSSDTENASPAIAYGPKDVSSVSCFHYFSCNSCVNLLFFLSPSKLVC